MAVQSQRVSRPDSGAWLLLTFVAAILIMVVAAAVVAVVGAWWVLVLAMLVDLVLTVAVIAMIAHLLRDDGESYA